MVVIPSDASRAELIESIIDTFLAQGFGSCVELLKEEDEYVITYTLTPKNEKSCRLEINVGKKYSDFLTILIGKKILYEEYEGMSIPDDGLFVPALLDAISDGRVFEKYFYVGSKEVGYEAEVKLVGFDPILIEKPPKNKLYSKNNFCHELFDYVPWSD